MRRRWPLLVSVLLACAGSVHGQGLRIRVLDAQSGEPVALALVSLVHGQDEVGDALTRGDGSRFFPADPNARYRLRVKRPGLETVTSGEFAVPRDTSAVEVRVSAVPLDLRAIRTSPRECRPSSGSPAFTLLEQAQTTMRLAELARAEGLEAIAIRRSERTTDVQGKQLEEREVIDPTLGARLFRSASNAALASRGFSYPDSVMGGTFFFGPDVSYFASTEFASSHCFVASEALEGAVVVLTFSPRDRATTQPDGIMWFDRESALLRKVDFKLLYGTARGLAGGEIVMERLPSGVWIARDWELSTPIYTSAGQHLGYREEVGEALQVSATMLALADSIANSRRPPGRINGVVMDSLSRRPLAGAVITVGPSGPSARSDSGGTFAIRSAPAGQHRLGIRHPLLDSIGTRIVPRPIRVGADSTTHVVLGGPSLRTLKGGACHDSLAVITGLVRDVASGAPIDSARVTLSWIEIVFQPDRPLVVNPVEITAESDSTGRYAACVPARLEITVSAEAGGVRTGRVDLGGGDRGLAVLYLSLDRTATDTLVGSAVIQGFVEYQDRTPLANATVMLTEPERSVVTDSAGRFRIGSVPGGTRVLDTRALGHAPVRTVVEARVGDTTVTRIFMRRVTQLDAVVVRASAGAASRALRELEERRRRGEGYRLNPVELLAFKHARLDAVARAVPFTTVQWSRGLPRVLLSGRGGRLCDPNVFVDGLRTPSDVLGDFPASEALAVEFFSRSIDVPLRYRTNNDCGAILLWTREGAKASSEAAVRRRR